MKPCAACGRELEPGYTFCHYCGAEVWSSAPAASGPAAAKPSPIVLADVVDRAQAVRTQYREATSTAKQTLDAVLGDPVSLQRQILYAILGGFALVPSLAFNGLLVWLKSWLVLSILIFVPVRYWMTGVIPLAATLNQVIGPEMSLRRRLVLAFLFMSWPVSILLYFGGSRSSLLGPNPGGGGASVQAVSTPGGCAILFLLLASGFLSAFYLMGFVASWLPVWGCEFSISREQMGEKAAGIATQIREKMGKKGIAGLTLTSVDMRKLRHFTAGDSSGTQGEQISFVCGKARIVVFVQDFGEDLFIRWAGYYDSTGRRLWLLIGYIVTALDRLALRWLGSGFLDWWQQISALMAPATRHQLVLRSTRGGIVSRTLRLADAVSEYAWNDIYALAHSVRDSVVAVILAAVSGQEEARDILTQLDKHMRMEAASGWAGRAGGR